MDLENRIAIVTGAARGIGRGVALELARAGCHVAVGDLLDRSDIKSAAAETLAVYRRALSR